MDYITKISGLEFQVQKLRQEKDVLEGRLKEFDRSLQKLKDHTYQEASQKREWERRVQALQADLRGANLREQVCCIVTISFMSASSQCPALQHHLELRHEW